MTIRPDGVFPFVWPVSLASVAIARDQFAQSSIAYVRSENVDVSAEAEALWLALPHLVADFCYIFQAATAGYRLAEMPWEVKFGETAMIAARTPIGLSPRIEFARTLPVGQPRWRRALRLVKGFISAGPVVARPPFAIDPERDVLTFQFLPNLFHQALVEGAGRVVIGRFDDWFAPASTEEDLAQAGMSTSAAAAYRQILADAFAAGGSQLDDQVADSLMRSADVMVRRVQSLLAQLERKRRHLPKQFWSGTGGNLMNRVFGRQVSRHGGKVTAFDHGMSTGLWDSWAQTLLEFNWADRFITFSERMAEGLRRNYSAAYMARPGHQCMIVVAADKQITEMAAAVPGLPRGRKIIYVPTLYAGRSTQILPLLPDIVAVDWQARLFAFLKAEGWSIGFKPHPESYCKPPDAFKQFGIELIDKPFEELAGDGAILLFDYPQSTAFRSALTSRRPIIFIDLPRLPLQPGIRELLARRCAIVSGWFDAENRVQVQWGELNEALQLAPQLADDTSARDALFPTGKG